MVVAAASLVACGGGSDSSTGTVLLKEAVISDFSRTGTDSIYENNSFCQGSAIVTNSIITGNITFEGQPSNQLDQTFSCEDTGLNYTISYFYDDNYNPLGFISSLNGSYVVFDKAVTNIPSTVPIDMNMFDSYDGTLATGTYYNNSSKSEVKGKAEFWYHTGNARPIRSDFTANTSYHVWDTNDNEVFSHYIYYSVGNTVSDKYGNTTTTVSSDTPSALTYSGESIDFGVSYSYTIE